MLQPIASWVLAEVPAIAQKPLISYPYILALDGISDPGNLGTLIRTAQALGFNSIFITKESADPFSSKALRAAKGATFNIPLQIGDISELLHFGQNNNYSFYVADTKGQSTFNFQTPLILILGNEAVGPSIESKKVGLRLAIPLTGQVESLNVAIAGGILMHKIKVETWKNLKIT